VGCASTHGYSGPKPPFSRRRPHVSCSLTRGLLPAARARTSVRSAERVVLSSGEVTAPASLRRLAGSWRPPVGREQVAGDLTEDDSHGLSPAEPRAVTVSRTGLSCSGRRAGARRCTFWCTCMGVSRYRTRSRSCIRDTGTVCRDASRVSARAVASAFGASAEAVRRARRERSHRRHRESSGGGVEADAWASIRAIGGTACTARCGFAGTGSGVEVRATAAVSSATAQTAGCGDRRAGRPAAARASVAAATAVAWRCLAMSGRRCSSRAGTRASWSWVPNVTCSPRHFEARERQAELLGPGQGPHQLVVAGTARRRPQDRAVARGRPVGRGPSPLVEISSATWRPRATVEGPTSGGSTTRGTGRWE
jgi:hypothetical protein